MFLRKLKENRKSKQLHGQQEDCLSWVELQSR